MSSEKGSMEAMLRWEGFDPFLRYQFDRRPFRRAMRRAGAVVSKEAKRRVSARAGNEYPNRKTGRLRKSIRVRVSRSGFLAKVEPTQRADMDTYYPAYLFFGTPTIKPKGHYMADSLQATRAEVVRILRAGLEEAI